MEDGRGGKSLQRRKKNPRTSSWEGIGKRKLYTPSIERGCFHTYKEKFLVSQKPFPNQNSQKKKQQRVEDISEVHTEVKAFLIGIGGKQTP